MCSAAAAAAVALDVRGAVAVGFEVDDSREHGGEDAAQRLVVGVLPAPKHQVQREPADMGQSIYFVAGICQAMSVAQNCSKVKYNSPTYET
mmetsp:Transcript_46408/g.79065  ORF Transcript_46408/g.79065 Transcript_46408/m.79065 type:complete len:91 (+) Transcript_46408:226-498(+)